MKAIQLITLILFSFIYASGIAQHTHVNEVPENIKTKFAKEHPKATNVEWEVDQLSSGTGHIDVFLVEYEKEDVKYRECFTMKGELVEKITKVGPNGLPQELKDSLNVHYPKAKIYTVEKIEAGKEGVFYSMMIQNDSGNFFIKMNPKGIIIFARKD